MTTTVYQLVIGDHLARSVRGVPCAPPCAAIEISNLNDRDIPKEHTHGRSV